MSLFIIININLLSIKLYLHDEIKWLLKKIYVHSCQLKSNLQSVHSQVCVKLFLLFHELKIVKNGYDIA